MNKETFAKKSFPIAAIIKHYRLPDLEAHKLANLLLEIVQHEILEATTPYGSPVKLGQATDKAHVYGFNTFALAADIDEPLVVGSIMGEMLYAIRYHRGIV